MLHSVSLPPKLILLNKFLKFQCLLGNSAIRITIISLLFRQFELYEQITAFIRHKQQHVQRGQNSSKANLPRNDKTKHIDGYSIN